MKGSRRAICIYLVEPFLLRNGNRKFLYHQNFGQALLIAYLLKERGFVVDVLDYRNNEDLSVVTNGYDLLISHRYELGPFGQSLPTRTRKLYLASGMNHRVSNKKLRERHEYLRKRRGCVLSNLKWTDENIEFPREADAVAGFGNSYTVGTWHPDVKGPIYPFNNYGFDWTEPIQREISRAKKNFLFFGSGQQLLKGLDLVLEFFPSHPELQLFVCGKFRDDPDFCRCYEMELFQSDNVHAIGFIRTDSHAFHRIASQCAFVIHPSCSEGQPGSTIQCMHTGMIPIVTRESGIDVEEFGILLTDVSVEGIESVVLNAAQMNDQTLKRMSDLTKSTAKSEYSKEAFKKRWRTIIDEVAPMA